MPFAVYIGFTSNTQKKEVTRLCSIHFHIIFLAVIFFLCFRSPSAINTRIVCDTPCTFLFVAAHLDEPPMMNFCEVIILLEKFLLCENNYDYS